MKKIAMTLTAALFAAPALALDPVGEAGWSGHVNLGVGGGQVESNFLAEIGGFGIDLGDEDLDTFGSPDSEDIFLPVADFEVGYTFRNEKTRITLGNDFADAVNFDRSSSVSIQHDFERWGRVEATFLNASLVETRVWEDPYLIGASRDDTEMAVSGGRIVWDRIFDTGLQFRASTRERDLDEERSGEGLGLSDGDRDLLDRNGDIIQVELSYLAQLNDRHSIRPSVRYIDRDLDGDAMAQDGVAVGLEHIFQGADFTLITNIAYAALDGDEENPIFNETHDVDRWTFSSVALFPGAFGWEKWVPNLSVVIGDEDSDIDFNDSSTWVVNAAVMRRF